VKVSWSRAGKARELGCRGIDLVLEEDRDVLFDHVPEHDVGAHVPDGTRVG